MHLLIKIISDLTALEWAMLSVLLLAIALVLLAAAENRDRSLRSRPMPLPEFHPEPARPDGYRVRHSVEQTRRLQQGVAPGPNIPAGRVSWLGGADSQGWWIWSDDVDNSLRS